MAKPDAAHARLIEEVQAKLAAGQRIRRTLPGDGRLYVERRLPFLALFRRGADQRHAGFEQLVTGEASYLFGDGDRKLRPRLIELAKLVCAAAQSDFGNSLLLELWPRPAGHAPLAVEERSITPAFRLYYDTADTDLEPLLEVLERHLRGVRVSGRGALVEVVLSPREFPERLRPLLSAGEARALGCSQVSIEVEPIFRGPDGGDPFPEVLRSLRSQISRALKRTFFFYAQNHTTFRPRDFHALGRRAMVKAAWEVDAQLDRISSGFDFLIEVNPLNSESVWSSFRRSRYEKLPPFRYRPLPIDPALSKRALFAIPIERIEDPTMAHLFRQKQRELDRKLTMLADRGGERFLLGSVQLYGRISPTLLRTAEEILERVPATTRSEPGGAALSPEAFVALAREEIAHYQQEWDGFDAEVRTTGEVASGLMVSRGHLLVAAKSRTPSRRADALLQHEVGTHLVTFYNGKAQKLTQLRTGLAGYEEFQEGLAVIAEYLVGGLTGARLRTLAGRVVGAHMLMEGATFVEAFRLLCRYGFGRTASFGIAVRLYRGGGLTKDLVYLRGLLRLLEYLEKDGELEPLYVGKIAAEHIPIVRELESRRVLTPPKVMPRFLQRAECQERLSRLRQGVQVFDLVE